ncbi:hypothetical protein RND81_12G201100 [Saponaria officinalis]|uniref:Poly [ADP-ribose] polymerase n=2 Tax=Saponaria officinalis TaxID=3572 RepID=A0AAW1HD28_SAPOF
MANTREVIDVNSYAADKAAGKTKQEGEVIDLDFYSAQKTNAVNTCLYPSPEVFDVDTHEYITSTKGKLKRDNVDRGSSSSSSTLMFDNAALCDGQVSGEAGTKEVMQVPKKQKEVIVTRKAPILPDQWVPDDVKYSHHVIEMGNTVYDAMLTQTHIMNNTNDFYVIQVLKANHASSYMVYNRWGTVGEPGEIKLVGPHSSAFMAIQEFEEIFYMKTKNHWSDRKNFVSYPKSYTWLEMNYLRKDQGQLSLPCAVKGTFGPRVEKFMSLICNFSMMKQQMTNIGYDVEKLPLQNLSKSTISKAYDVLTLIAEVIGESNRVLLEELSGEFYTIIPHVFGEKMLRQFVIDTHQKLRSKLEMVESLGEIEHATKLLRNCAGPQEDVMFAQYKLLRCALAPVEATTEEFQMIEKYMTNTARHTTAKIVEIFKVSKEGENDRFKKYARKKNRMLLWHGSRLTNWLGILSQGLRIAPKQVPLSGASFGRGLYFADMFDKSVSYCFRNSGGDHSTGILLLCEVALGDMLELSGAQRIQHLPPGKLSVKALGRTAPSEYQVLKDGVIIPTGKAVTDTSRTMGIMHNEYIVYNEDQVRMRYIVQVDFKGR